MMQLGARVNLIICQKSKVQDWVEHIHANYEECVIYNLTVNGAVEDFIEWTIFKDKPTLVGVINYELAWRRPQLLKLAGFTLMLDESSLIQNAKSKRAKFIAKLQPANVILLSGTPCAGRYENLTTQAHLLGWDISDKLYDSQYINHKLITVGDAKHKVIDNLNPYKNVERLKAKLREHGAVFLKTEECMQLPEQQFEIIRVPATKEYRHFTKHKVVAVSGHTLVGDTQFAERLHQRELCGMYCNDKLDAFRDLLDSTNDRLIVFYNFDEELYHLQEIAAERPQSVCNGKAKDLTAYDEHSDSVTFVQYQAGAMGLNLQKANKIIYFTLPDGRSDLFEQSKKRIHRIGQSKPCFYYLLVCRGTVEEDILKTLDVRRAYTDELFKGE